MKIRRLTIAATLCLALSACFQTNLGGPTGGTTITVASLREGTVIATAETRTEQFWIDRQGQQSWDEQNPLVRLLLIGLLTQDDIPIDPADVNPNALYLVTATGGVDSDPQSGRSVSDNPEAVQGIWHAIVTGQRLLDGGIQVSAISEAIYQQVVGRIARLTDAGVTSQLDAAARLLLTDTDRSGSVDYDDVMDFSRSLDADKYRGDIANLDALSAAIRANQPPASLQTLSAAVLGSHRVVMTTNFGDLVMDTLNWEAPVNADNFLRYVEDDFYDNIVFHRVIDGFVAQAGIWELLPGTNQVDTKQTRAPVFNESRYSISNQRGTVAMARTNDPNSATSQFYVNQVDNSFLDYSPGNSQDGYTVFATLASGIEVIDDIAAIPTVSVGGIGDDVPSEIVLIESAIIQY